MSRIKRYQYNGEPLPEKLHADGGWIKGGADGYISKKFYYRSKDDPFTVYIAFDRDMSEWNDFDNVMITETEWDEMYQPFFSRWDEEIEDDPKLKYIIEVYNNWMDTFPFLSPLDNMYKRYA